MSAEINEAVCRLLDKNPDVIPRFVLLKEFKKIGAEDLEYQNLYDQVCGHPFVRKFENTQNERGFWPPFHGCTEAVIRKLLSFGLDRQHPCLKKVSDYLVRVLSGEEDWDQYEKQDNVLWWPRMFVPVVSAAMLSLIDREHEAVETQRQHCAYIAAESFADGKYDRDRNRKAVEDCFGVATKRPIQPFNYFCLLLLAPDGDRFCIDPATDQALVDYCMKEAECIYYVYNNRLSDMVPISAHNRDSRDFWHWIRALSLISQFHGWTAYRDTYTDWILSQAGENGLWEFPRKFDYALSDSWRGKNKEIDSSVFVLKMLSRLRAF